MTTSPRVTSALLDELAATVAVSGRRDPLPVEAPFTADTLGAVPLCSPDDVVAAGAAARKAGEAWARVPTRDRAAVLLRFATIVLDRQDEILDLIQLESGKARRHAFEEVIDVAQVCRYYARTAERHLSPRRRAGAVPGLTKTWELRHPKGVVGIISPWNYPLTLGVSDALPALVAGNAVLAKPDERTPYSALWAARALERAGLPHGVLSVVTGPGADLGAAVVEASDFVMFTGSTRVGRIVAAQAASRLVDFSMELGGKNASLVLDDAHVGKAVEGNLRAAFANTGQLCVSSERLLVHERVWDEFVERFAKATARLRLGSSLDYRPDLGSLVSAQQLATVAKHVDDARAKGATVLAGGRPRPDVGPYFYEPTVLTDTRPDMMLYADETFGPVVAVRRVGSADEAIALANDSRFGLNFAVWTRDPARGRAVAAQLHAGTVNVNDAYGAAWASVDAPMGGMKDSGVGRRHGEHGILKYTEPQTIASQHLLPIAPPRLIGARRYAVGMTAALRAMQRVPWLK